MSEYLSRLLNDLALALERNSAELESNSNDIRSLLIRIEAGEITPSDAEAQKLALAIVSDRLQQERLDLVSAARDLRLRGAPDQTQTHEESRREASSEASTRAVKP